MTTAVQDAFAGLNVSGVPQAKPRDRLDQGDFLKLMTAQLANQDPFKPLESGEFMGQIAQFSSVQGIQDLQNSFASFAAALTPNQSLQSAALVGRDVLVPAEAGVLGADGLSGAFELPAAGEVTIRIRDGAGALVKELPLGMRPAGISGYKWDGAADSGALLDTGSYFVEVTAMVGGASGAVPHLAQARVESVVLGRPGEEARVNLAGLGRVNLSQLREIR